MTIPESVSVTEQDIKDSREAVLDKKKWKAVTEQWRILSSQDRIFQACPIGRALQRASPQPGCWGVAGNGNITPYGAENQPLIDEELFVEEAGVRFILDFDLGKPVLPITLEIERGKRS